ncbi:hypothetical protein [Hymenobacter cellulosilyticus]|uniref:Orotate phosphoribosyltransferase n=1 Tax=Hymenobacter cellulosilyticus TaxID=2932248 RepID=A0A8T9QB95_9BACT|nr:hypothetical protein [Hymenobacter cellulosilyticus]UOQ72799.1 hypothetical protein MUN79_02050 [Hymenobacter cellulosilyticus]
MTSSQTSLTSETLEQQLLQEDALLRGHFRLSSGLHSDTYVQCARFLRRPDLAARPRPSWPGRFSRPVCNLMW